MTNPLDPDRFSPDVAGGINQAAAVGFERGADDYEQARPSYPAAAVDLIVEVLGIGPGRRVLDLAAGTGKFTRLLSSTGADLVAVEPVAAMRAQLLTALPTVTALDGTAEEIPLADASVDAVVVAQAFHWFDAPVALAEVHRVLRRSEGSPGGLALIWNERNEQVDWVRQFGQILVEAAGHKPYVDGTDWPAVVAETGGFGPLRDRRFAYDQTITPDLLIARAASTSFVSALPDEERGTCLAEVRRLIDTHPDLAERARLVFPYLTHVYWCDRS
jgi:SAM-dependent methyltransferase